MAFLFSKMSGEGNKKQYQRKDNEWKSVAKDADSDIIETRNIAQRHMANGMRTSPLQILLEIDHIIPVSKGAGGKMN